MDIIQLLEVLKPAKDVVTVQIASKNDSWGPVIDLLKAVLPAFATAGVAWLAMNRSHKHFEINSERQSAEFKLGIEQQTKTLKIHTQLATEIDLKKEICKGVREACADFLTYALEANQHNIKYETACEYISKGGSDFIGDRNASHDNFMKAWHNSSSSKLVLLTFLDPEVDAEFYNSITKVESLLPDGGTAFGHSVGECLAECREYIAAKQREIIELPVSIAGEKQS